MKQLLLEKGDVRVENVPSPWIEPATVLVAVEYSCISIGTEIAGVRNRAAPLWQQAMRRPQEVRTAIHLAREQGVRRIYGMARRKIAGGTPLGYSAAGRIIEVGDGIPDVRVGQWVACAGAQSAHHAEIIRVPRNLLTPIPDNVDPSHASTVALGAIAIQGVRRLRPTLGESFVVFGLGMVGQLTVQLLKANGCRVIAIDVNRARADLAARLGADSIIHADDVKGVDQVYRLTDGFGADGVVVTAASTSDTPMSQAFQMCRRKGRVVLVGDVGLNLNREDLFKKELDFLISSSYGPGRYDPTYEDGGIDYPHSYVRWTENRNMAEYLRLISRNQVQLAPLITNVIDIDRAPEQYAALRDGAQAMGVVLRYSARQVGPATNRKIENPSARSPRRGALRIGVVGAGGFAKGMHLPVMMSLPHSYSIRGVMSRSGHNAQTAAKQFAAHYATTSFDQLLNDPDIDVLLVTTRHDQHARLTLAGLEAGKHVLVEKPLALTQDELNSIVAFYESKPDGPVLMTGFNRRFSPHAVRIREIVAERSNPMIISYGMNAGYAPLDHWVHGPEGGGRNRGEACHLYDLFTCLTGSRVATVSANTIDPATAHYSAADNFVASMTFSDGSVATLTYTALGSSDYPKETMELYVDGKVLRLDDYKTLTVTGSREKGVRTRTIEKGHRQELIEFATSISRGEWPIPLWQQVQATDIALRVETQIHE